jgi:hypothetical protein
MAPSSIEKEPVNLIIKEDKPSVELKASEILQQKLDYNNYLKEKIQKNLANRPVDLDDESEGYSPLRKMPVVPDLSPIREPVQPSPIKVEQYIKNERLQESMN